LGALMNCASDMVSVLFQCGTLAADQILDFSCGKSFGIA